MPTLRHFMKRHAWHDLRLRLVISHSLVAGQLYSIFPAVRQTQNRWAEWRRETVWEQISVFTCTHTRARLVPRWPYSQRRGGFSDILMGRRRSTSRPWVPPPIWFTDKLASLIQNVLPVNARHDPFQSILLQLGMMGTLPSFNNMGAEKWTPSQRFA